MLEPTRRNLLEMAALPLVAATGPSAAAAPRTDPADTGAKTLPKWQPGLLDIHHISTGRGSCAFLLCPDGTTMTIDAGSVIPDLQPATARYTIDARPDSSLRPGQWIARYIARLMKEAGRQEIDYFLLTHFHSDHMGTVFPGNLSHSPMSRFGAYQLGGLADLAETVPVRTIIDRNYPLYDYPIPLHDAQIDNYRAFIQSFVNRGGKVQRLIPGLADQIRLTRQPDRFPSFSIRNLAANGEVWTGIGQETRSYFPDSRALTAADRPTENKCSLAIRLSYGKFDYFSAGDMDHDRFYGRLPWGDIESVVARVAGPVDVAVANHHGYVDACGAEWTRALRASCYVINAWDSAHPTLAALNNMLSRELYPGVRRVYSTAMKPENAIATRRVADLTSQNGHVIFRVAPGGGSFDVFVVSNADESGEVLAHQGPIPCA